MPNQAAAFTLNGDTDGSRALISHSLSFNSQSDKATIVLSVVQDFSNETPIFDWWMGREPAKVELTIVNLNQKDGENERDIVLENALCINYTESFNSTVPFEDICYPIATLVIEAETVTIGGTSFIPS